MASLREIKDRIGSVRTTLKITSAMKLVASAKLRKAQSAIESMLPYQKALSDILTIAINDRKYVPAAAPAPSEDAPASKVAVVAIASNSSLCGGFNAIAIKTALEQISQVGDADVFAVGRKMSDKLRKSGYESMGDYTRLSGAPSYADAKALAEQLIEGYDSGRYSRVILVYNHFVSTSTYKTMVETYLPFSLPEAAGEESDNDCILEPGPREIVDKLLPQVLGLKIYTVLLDSAAAEYAARTIAMQTATDNAEDILGELTLEYNKGRQQKITAEILDLLGGAQ